MKHNLLRTVTISLAAISLFSCTPHDFTCTLKGTVIDRKSDTLMLKRINEDERFVKIFIPIVNGKFEYKMVVKDIEAWDLTFLDEYNNGGWRDIQFFPDQKEVHFVLYPTDQYEKNSISGGEVNQAMNDYNIKRMKHFGPRLKELQKVNDSLNKNKLLYSEEFEKLMTLSSSAKTDAEEKAINSQIESLQATGMA